jgi:hypothetical protein
LSFACRRLAWQAMRGWWFRLLPVAVLAFSSPLGLFATQDSCVTLLQPIRTNAEVRFYLTGETSATYVIESSTNLQHWAAVSTNLPGLITVPLPESVPALFLRASRGPLPVFSAALTARSNIVLTGNEIRVDSYDSADLNYRGPMR